MSFIEITKDSVRGLLPERPSNSHKGSFGKVLNIAGCSNYRGAAILSSVAPLKIGAGLVTLASIEPVLYSASVACPSLTFLELKSDDKKYISESAYSDILEKLTEYDVISIGPGLSTNSSVKGFLFYILESLKDDETKVVLDADALNLISELDYTNLPKNAVMTPHPKELSRLLDVDVQDIQNNRVDAAIMASKKYGCGVILKGEGSVICFGDEVFVNTTGNSSMAKAGSGDVLTGMISGLAAQGLSIKGASLLGVYLHGKCGELASEKLTKYCVMASDQIEYIPFAIKSIME